MSQHHLKPGDQAPDFELPAIGDKTIKLSDYQGTKNVILSFHPLAWTGICAQQMQDLEARIEELIDKDTVALGISVDTVPSKTAWAESLGITQTELLSDFEPKGAVASQYGVYRDDGIAERSVFVINKQGVIIFSRVLPIAEKPDLAEIILVIPG